MMAEFSFCKTKRRMVRERNTNYVGGKEFMPILCQRRLRQCTNISVGHDDSVRFLRDHWGMFLCLRVDPVVEILHNICNERKYL